MAEYVSVAEYVRDPDFLLLHGEADAATVALGGRGMNGSAVVIGDNLEVMRRLKPCSVDAIVTDPPYGIGFMGKAWDGKAIEEAAQRNRPREMPARLTGSPDSKSRKMIPRSGSAFANRAGEAGAYDFSIKGNRAFQLWTETWAREALRVLKPGGHALVFGGTRTYHRMAAGLEDAGFEIRDCMAWLYGSGFPKSLDVSKAIDKQAGVEREVDGEKVVTRVMRGSGDLVGGTVRAGVIETKNTPVAAAAAAWQGWGTALKPAFEPVVVARKPLEGTVAANVLKYGTGAINVDGCRIGTTTTTYTGHRHDGSSYGVQGGHEKATIEHDIAGRWPANLLLDEEAAAMLDEQSGELAHGTQPKEHDGSASVIGDSGGASRFFYVAKVSSAERNAGCNDFDSAKVHGPSGDGRCWDIPGSRSQPRKNNHPTVKPIALMRYLVRLVTPPGGLVLDPFCGSGSTGIAASLEHFRFLGIEQERPSVEIARARIRHFQAYGEKALEAVKAQEEAEALKEAGQMSILDALAEAANG